MIVDERIITFINSLDAGNTEVCNTIERQAKADFVPIIRKEMQSFLKVMLMIKRPKKILEVGAAVGFSSVLMSEYMPSDCKITTIEKFEKRIEIAKENIKFAGKEDKIELLEGDALDILKTLEGPYDFIFMDAAKGQYINFYGEVMRLLADDGILISDNVLQDGEIIESKYGIVRRNRTIHSRMREYLFTLKHDDRLETTIVPIGDGITMSIKLRKMDE